MQQSLHKVQEETHPGTVHQQTTHQAPATSFSGEVQQSPHKVREGTHPQTMHQVNDYQAPASNITGAMQQVQDQRQKAILAGSMHHQAHEHVPVTILPGTVQQSNQYLLQKATLPGSFCFQHQVLMETLPGHVQQAPETRAVPVLNANHKDCQDDIASKVRAPLGKLEQCNKKDPCTLTCRTHSNGQEDKDIEITTGNISEPGGDEESVSTTGTISTSAHDKSSQSVQVTTTGNQKVECGPQTQVQEFNSTTKSAKVGTVLLFSKHQASSEGTSGKFSLQCMYQISNAINEHSIGTISIKDSEKSVKTPDSLMVGSNQAKHPGALLSFITSKLLERFFLVQDIATYFHRKWIRKVDPELIIHSTQHIVTRNHKVRDVVLVGHGHRVKCHYSIDGQEVERKVLTSYKNYRAGEFMVEYSGVRRHARSTAFGCR